MTTPIHSESPRAIIERAVRYRGRIPPTPEAIAAHFNLFEPPLREKEEGDAEQRGGYLRDEPPLTDETMVVFDGEPAEKRMCRFGDLSGFERKTATLEADGLWHVGWPF
jgi:hypothetical protein